MVDARIRRMARIELARRDFWAFCKLMAPDFYREDRPYLKTLCRRLQAFCESDRKVLVVNMPPRHGKSRTAVLLSQWLFGRDPSEQIMTGSYNETLSTTFARAVRDGIAEERFDPNRIVFSDIFPQTRIKYGEAAAGKWALEGQYASYLATSPGGTATGFGARKLILDDLIKKAEEAFNEGALDKQWQWFTDTMLSRTETGYKIVIIMTRWATGDLAGRALEHWPDAELITMKALQDDGTMLCDAVLTREDYEDKVRTMSEEIASANYQQQPIDLKGRLYSSFKTYTDIPKDEHGKPLFTHIRSYTDTADTGADYLCSIIYGEYNHVCARHLLHQGPDGSDRAGNRTAAAGARRKPRENREQQRRPRLCPQRAGAVSAARLQPLPCGVVPSEREQGRAYPHQLNVGAGSHLLPGELARPLAGVRKSNVTLPERGQERPR